MKNTTTINSKLYSTLFDEGLLRGIDSDRLIAVYCIIKASKRGSHRILPQGKVKYYRLLHRITKLSEKTLKKYVPILEELEVFNFSKDGGAYIKGNDKTNKEFNSRKVIKLEVGNLSETSLNSYFVRIKAKEQRIKNAIDKTDSKIKVMSKFLAKKYLNRNEYRLALKLTREGVTLKQLKSHHNKVVLSNCGFYNLKKEVENNKSAGNYWKIKLKSAGKIKTRRNSILIRKATKMEFLYERQDNPRLSYWKGFIWEESISEFTTSEFITNTPYVNIAPKKETKKLEYLSFDWIAWSSEE